MSAMKKGLPRWERGFFPEPTPRRRPDHVGMDLSRTRLDVHVMNDAGETLDASAWPPDRDGVGHLVRYLVPPLQRQRDLQHLGGMRSFNETFAGRIAR